MKSDKWVGWGALTRHLGSRSMNRRPSYKTVLTWAVVLVPWLFRGIWYEALEALPLLAVLSAVCMVLVLIGVTLQWPPTLTASSVLIAQTTVCTVAGVVIEGEAVWRSFVASTFFCLLPARAVLAVLGRREGDSRVAFVRAAQLGALSLALFPYSMAIMLIVAFAFLGAYI